MFFRCVYYTMNHATWSPFVSIIITFWRSLLNSFFTTILLKVVFNGILWSIIRGIELSTRLPIMMWDFSLKRFILGIIMFWPMGDTWLLISGLVPKIITESSSKDIFLPCSSIFLEGFDELFHARLLLLLQLEILQHHCFDNWQRKKNIVYSHEKFRSTVGKNCESKVI